MALDKSEFLNLAIRDIARKYFRATQPTAAGAAPILEPDAQAIHGLNFVYPFYTSQASDVVGTAPVLTSETATLTDLSLSLDDKVVSLDQYDLGVFRVSDSTADGFAAANATSAQEEFVAELMSRAYTFHSLSTRDEAVAELDNESINVDADFSKELKELRNEIDVETLKLPDTILMAPEAVTALSEQAFIRDFPALSVTSTDGVVKAGDANEEQVRAYFSVVHGLDLIVDRAVSRASNSSDPRERVWGSYALLCRAAGGFGGSTLHTFVQYAGDILRVEARRNSGNMRIGYSVAAEGTWKVEATAPETGRLIDLGDLGS